MPESSWRKYQRDPCREQARIERESKDAKAERICRAVRSEPAIECWQLAERFNQTAGAIADVLHRAGFRWNGSEWVPR